MQTFTNHITKSKLIPQISIGLLSLLLLFMLCPMRTESAGAVPELTEGQSQAERTTKLKISVQSAISLAMNDRLDVDVVPKSNGSFNSAGTQVSVATNNITGYGIYLSTKDGTQNLSSASTEISDTIGPVSNAVSANNFPANSWGYQLLKSDGTILPGNDGLYRAVPLPTDGAIYNTAQGDGMQSSKDIYLLNFGTSINTELPSGVYTNSVIVSVVANPRQAQNLDEAVYMQDMDGTRNADGTVNTKSRICENSPIGMTNQLIDSRDGKKYWVAKLADGNCWMTQNLDVDITTDGFTNADTDLSIDAWDATTTDRHKPSKTSAAPGKLDTSFPNTGSWDVGKWVLATPAAIVSLDSSCSPAPFSCRPRGFVDVSDETKWTPTYSIEQSTAINADGEIFYQQNADGTKGTTTSAMGSTRQPLAIKWNEDGTGGEYDPHYLMGNYYSFNAATAGYAGQLHVGLQADSICPRGWRLPPSFDNLLTQYGVNSRVSGTGLSTNEATAGKSYNIALAPLYFVRGGTGHAPSGMIYSAVGTGSYWISSDYVSQGILFGTYVSFGDSKVAAASTAATDTMPMRCVAY